MSSKFKAFLLLQNMLASYGEAFDKKLFLLFEKSALEKFGTAEFWYMHLSLCDKKQMLYELDMLKNECMKYGYTQREVGKIYAKAKLKVKVID